jgi:hypothetical protein
VLPGLTVSAGRPVSRNCNSGYHNSFLPSGSLDPAYDNVFPSHVTRSRTRPHSPVTRLTWLVEPTQGRLSEQFAKPPKLIAMVASVDMVVTISGKKHTEVVVEQALELGLSSPSHSQR